MLSTQQAINFARNWINAWNSHDLNCILEYYTDDFEMTTPFMIKFMNHPTGTLKGKDTIKPYWEKALRLIPNLKFQLIEVLSSVDSISIYYQAILGKRGVEVLFLNPNGRIYKSVAHFNSI